LANTFVNELNDHECACTREPANLPRPPPMSTAGRAHCPDSSATAAPRRRSGVLAALSPVASWSDGDVASICAARRCDRPATAGQRRRSGVLAASSPVASWSDGDVASTCAVRRCDRPATAALRRRSGVLPEVQPCLTCWGAI